MLLILNVLVAYGNHFRNDFHFDDITAIPENPAIRDPGTIAKAFVDANLFSSAPGQRTYRPVTTASLALDYWIAGGLDTFYFHLSNFFWFSLQLVLMLLLYERLMDRADPHPANFWTALAAAAAFGLHPVSAETVNYIVQRGDLYNTLGSIASLWLFIRYPSQRKFAWYLLPAAAGMLAKPPALIFPLLLLAYVLLFEQAGAAGFRKWMSTILSVLPATLLAAAAAYLSARMQPTSWKPGNVSSALSYRIEQPYVALHYFRSFFLPTGLNVDPGWQYIAPFSLQAVAGYIFVLAAVAVAVGAARTRAGKPVAFGIIWFFVTLLPTSLMPLGDITNDHRMFFAFVGLTLAVFWSLRLALFRWTARLTRNHLLVRASLAALVVILVVAGAATRARNRVWSSEETLWLDATEKNPRNPKAWINYSGALDRLGRYEEALSAQYRAAALDPDSPQTQSNLILALKKLHRGQDAEIHYQKLVAMNPPFPGPYIAYAEWLASVGRFSDSGRLLSLAATRYPGSAQVRSARHRFYLARDAGDRIAVLKVLDPGGDLYLSEGDIFAAPQALASLDKNGDGKLSAEECGADFGDESRLDPVTLRRLRRQFLQSQPILLALDADRDGEISAREIRDSPRALRSLLRSGESELGPRELDPPWVVAEAQRILALLDRNHDRQIDQEEQSQAAAKPFRDLLNDADVGEDGIVTLDELINEIFYRADLNKDGTVTEEELDAARTAGAFGHSAVLHSTLGTHSILADLKGN